MWRGPRGDGTSAEQNVPTHGDGTNIKMIGADVVRDSTDAYGYLATRATGVTFMANAAGTDYAGAPTRVCNACHGISGTPACTKK